MIELRWARRVVGKLYDANNNTAFNDDTRLVLQMRTQYDATVYAGMATGTVPRNMVWTDWKDVPIVPEHQ
jgi:hypothetical protein